VRARDEHSQSVRPKAAGEGEQAGQRGRSAAEWTTLTISVAIIAGLVAMVTYVSMTGGNEPPIVEARSVPAALRYDGESYYLPVAVTNRGGRTAEQVLIQAELAGDDGSSEVSEFTIDFLAGGETTEGTAVFATDPLAGELTIDVVSFQSP